MLFISTTYKCQYLSFSHIASLFYVCCFTKIKTIYTIIYCVLAKVVILATEIEIKAIEIDIVVNCTNSYDM